MVVVFVGPSLDPAVAAAMAPHATIRRPARRGDFDGFTEGDVVLLLDGVFDAELAITPREIRNALSRGVRVIGASSMGALRAAEVREVVGVGRIYSMFKDGTLERDDEVALLLDVDSGRALTEPLVNVRYAAERLASEGTLDAARAEAIVAAASRLPFHDRTFPNILAESGLGRVADRDVLLAALRRYDLKREDAHTALEGLDDLAADARWRGVRVKPEGVGEYDDPFARARVRRSARADAPVVLWETGDQVEFRTLVRFLGLTGALDAAARRAVGRFLLDDGQWSGPSRAPKTPVPSVQELFDDAATTWGWKAPEEAHVTLNDLGLGRADLQERLREERSARARLLSLYEKQPAIFLRALRADLFLDDLSLKRAVFRLGALEWLAARAPVGAPTNEELDDARRAFLCARPDLTWRGLLVESGLAADDAHPLVERLARARRVGVPLLAQMEAAPTTAAPEGAFVPRLPEAARPPGTHRAMSDEEALAHCRDLSPRIGITRVASLGELEGFGLHVTAAYRPSTWSSTIGSGKSERRDGAYVGAVMEEVEKYCQERFAVDTVTVATIDEVAPRAVAPDAFDLPFDTPYRRERPLSWTTATDLLRGEEVLVPTSLLNYNRERGDILFSERRGSKIFTTNGLASGFTVTEALVHGLAELIERHACALADRLVSNPGFLSAEGETPFSFVDLATAPPSTQAILENIRRAGCEVRVMNVTSEIAIPTFSVRILRPSALHGLSDKFDAGYCAHPDAEVALNRALLEAVQTRISSISGAREDLGMKARSLGRHERPRPLSRGDALWIRPYVPKVPFSRIPSFVSGSARADLSVLTQRLAAAGYERVLFRELTASEVAPACVIRAFVPGIETLNPFFSGPRARVLTVRDMMRRHLW